MNNLNQVYLKLNGKNSEILNPIYLIQIPGIELKKKWYQETIFLKFKQF
jgi:hypothetical protein